MVKMIVVDLDGTLLNSEEKVSNETKKYLEQLKNNGYIITIATGRSYSSALNVTDDAKFANYIITDSGACTFDANTFKEIFSNYISEEVTAKILDYYSDNCKYIYFSNKDIIYKYSDEIENNSIISTTKDKKYILDNCKNITHINIALKTNQDLLWVYKEITNKFDNIEVTIMQDSFSDFKWITILPLDCSKYNMIKTLANSLDINDNEIIAFGDGLNDVDMLEKCGFGVALLNALPEVKEKSDDITIFDNNNDGVIDYLKRYLNDEK